MTGLTHLKTYARVIGGVDVGLEMALVFYDKDTLSKDDFLGEVNVPIPANGTLKVSDLMQDSLTRLRLS